jgi:type IV pilus assembly protein PilC
MDRRAMKISARQRAQALFWRKFMRLTRGRVGILRALEVIAEEEKESAFRAVVDSIRTSLDGGSTLSEAIGACAGEFSPAVRELVKTAEKTGAWDEILQEIADGLAEGTFR